MRQLFLLALLMTALGCSKYTWDETANRCREDNSGQFVEDQFCGK